MKQFRAVSRPLALTIGCALLLGAVAGCSTSRVELGQSTSTSVSLTSKNYKLIQAGAEGTSYGFRLLGVIPFASPHYASARKALYASVDESLKGKAVALTNETRDKSTVYLVLFSIPKYTITGDVIEFVDKTDQAPAPAPEIKTAEKQ